MTEKQYTIQMGENSPEFIAYKLMHDIFRVERADRTREEILNTYAECLYAVRGYREFS